MTEESPVVLRVYDISRGMAKSMSMAMLGKQIDGIWHSGLKVFGREYSFGGGMVEGATSGISIAQPHEWEQLYGPCAEEINLGTTAISRERFDDFVKELGQTSFTQASLGGERSSSDTANDRVPPPPPPPPPAAFVVGAVPRWISLVQVVQMTLAMVLFSNFHHENGSDGAPASSTSPATSPATAINVASLKVVELRAELRARGRSTSGLKSELTRRLQETLATEAAAEGARGNGGGGGGASGGGDAERAATLRVGARVARELDGVVYHGVVVGTGVEEEVASRMGQLLWDVRYDEEKEFYLDNDTLAHESFYADEIAPMLVLPKPGGALTAPEPNLIFSFE